MTGVFIPGGDIGIVLRESGAPIWAGVVALLVGLAGTAVAGRVATARLLAAIDPAGPMGEQLRSLGLFSWLLGSALAILVSIAQFDGSAAWFEVLGAVTVGLFLFFVRFFMRRLDVHGAGPRFDWPWLGIRFLLIVAVLRQLVLANGLAR